MCGGIEKHEWDELTPLTLIGSFFERPNDVTDDSYKFGSFKGRAVCVVEALLCPLKILALEIIIVFSVATAALLTAWRLVDALFRPSRWGDFAFTFLQLLEFTVTALILPLKIVELAIRYLLGAVIHPGAALRRINA